jgi:vesicle-fusing ATPase
MGPAAILELSLLPKLWKEFPTIFEKNALMGGAREDMTMTSVACGWDPSMLQFLPEEDDKDVVHIGADSIREHAFDSLEGIQRNAAIRAHFQSSVGGLQPQIDAIVRRVLDGRNICTMIKGDTDEDFLNRSRLEAEELALLGLRPVRGVLLFGQPGVGKTMIAREIARLISRTPPKIVAASELLDRWVGGSERLVRELFHDAEVELKRLQETASVGEEDRAFLNSALHVIIVDEIDAVFRRRTDSNDSGSNSRDSVVNQMLAKLDGVNALPNILLIGMTNRRELLDPALLRPGRLEVQIEIPLPQQSQRREILQLHFGPLRRRNRLSYPLRCAIDGVSSNANDGDSIEETTPSKSRKRKALRNAAKCLLDVVPPLRPIAYDLAAETDGFSGADIAGLVRCAGSRALARTRQAGTGVESIIITLDDIKQAIDEVSGGRIRQR